MSSPRAASNDDDKHSGNSKEAAVAKTAGFIVFSGIAMSILKTLNPFNKERNATAVPQQPVEAGGYTEQRSPEYSQRVIDIVSIDAIKEANGLTGDTIYAGKKLIIP
ncbi:hypothetical protein GOBAR_AA32436 [Gossypium barbadense]|uniref:LysM domain-containing protein n=1 Tax=Gossypium barbadense TaxID=3634 RepID=A0A2P5WAZ2_GOSBA|nr:hypothetical protein GOBAR_AA32436 [Gossypium barbadense]